MTPQTELKLHPGLRFMDAAPVPGPPMARSAGSIGATFPPRALRHLPAFEETVVVLAHPVRDLP